MEFKREINSSKKRKKTRRGYGVKNLRKNNLNEIKLSIIGTNSAGLKGKTESFFSLINIFSPSIITIQETKHKRIGTTKLAGYQTFEMVRANKGGGGLLKAVKEDLNPVLVSQRDDDVEIVVVEADLGRKKLRIINGYGPQEDDDVQDILNFWQEFEKTIIQAVDDQCLILIELDANTKLGNKIIKNDPHSISNKNARRPKEAHIARNLKEIKMIDRAGEDF